MHRSGSSTRVSNELFSSSSASPQLPAALTTRPSLDPNEVLPIFDPLSPAADKKETPSDFRYAHHAVHLIPVVLLLCALTLWLFSNPEGRILG